MLQTPELRIYGQVFPGSYFGAWGLRFRVSSSGLLGFRTSGGELRSLCSSARGVISVPAF